MAFYISLFIWIQAIYNKKVMVFTKIYEPKFTKTQGAEWNGWVVSVEFWNINNASQFHIQ